MIVKMVKTILKHCSGRKLPTTSTLFQNVETTYSYEMLLLEQVNGIDFNYLRIQVYIFTHKMLR